jgi:uncharacterized protein
VSADRCLLVYTKPARPGRVKTRLIGDLTAHQAAELHAAFLGDLLQQLAGGDFALRLAWDLGPGEEPPLADPPGERQQGDDLGERLYRGLAAAARTFPLVAAVGSDHPTLSRRRVEEAFTRLDGGADVVLGPAADGGYYLVGVRAEALDRRLFAGVPWSTGEVLAATLERCRRLGRRPALLAAAADVDTPGDLADLVLHLSRDGEGCPRTRRLLASWGRLPAAASRELSAAGGRDGVRAARAGGEAP